MRAGFVISKLQGEGGEVWVGKSVRAASLKSWIAIPVEARPGAWEFAGRLDERDEYLLTQAPNSVRLPLGHVELRWTGVLEIEGESVRATFDGPPEER